jgi:ribosomal-protein-alanine N-acetyltransferase
LEITIRKAVVSDVSSIQAVERSSFNWYYHSTDQDLERRILSNINHIFVLDIGKIVAGYVYLIEQDGTTDSTIGLQSGENRILQVGSIAIVPEYRKYGFAQELLEYGIEALNTTAAPGLTRSIAEVDSSNSASIALFLSLGYRPSEHLPGYYPNGSDAVRLSKCISKVAPFQAVRLLKHDFY